MIMLEYYTYYPIAKKQKYSIGGSKNCISMADIKSQLPESMVKEFLPPPNEYCVTSLYIEKNKTEIIKKLDETWWKKGKLGKNRQIEVAKNEIDNYDYYFVDLKNIDWNKDIFYDFEKPSCSHETCPWGTKIISEITIANKIVGKYDFVKISGAWDQNVKFLISNRIKKLFDENCLTGLSYETCEVQSPTKSEKEDVKYFIAKVTTSYKKMASDIRLRDYCKKHSIIIDATPINIKYPNTTSKDDFQIVDRILVDKKEYTLRSPWFFISRRVLRILLDNKVKDLRSMALFIKKGFSAVPFG